MNRNIPALVLRILLAVLFLLLFGALFRLQVVRGDYYRGIAENNIVRIRRIPATRGEIYDNKYRPIAVNVPSHNLYLTSGKVSNIDALSVFLYRSFGITRDELHNIIFQQRFKTYEEILLADNIPYETVLALSERMNYYPELSFRVGTTRSYLYPNHFTGYVGRINEDEYKRYREEDYSLNGYIGKTGLEKFYEVLLRGQDGKEVVQVDARGKSLDLFRSGGSKDPLNGLSLVLSIDNDLQTYANEVFPAGMKGAIVVSDIKTGGILAYVSKPDYDPNLFMQRISPSVWAGLNSPDKPLLDRVSQATYPPGSVFKPVTAMAGLDAGLINRNTMLATCTGGLKIGTRFFRCWSSAGHGSSNVVNALKVSCDVFFYDLINRMDVDAAYKYAKGCMVVDPTGIDLPTERSGLYPNSAWYKKKLGRTSGLQGHKANLAIGQGEVLTSPLQINALYAAIARGGEWIQPHLLTRTLGRGRLSREEVQPLAKKHLPCSDENLKIIQTGLWEVCNAPGGTGRAINVSGATAYGKTGSAENALGRTTHAWFTGYIVTDKPEIVVTVFLENAGGGGAMAAPITNKIMNYYIGNLERIKKPAPLPERFRGTGDEPREDEQAPPAQDDETPPATNPPVDIAPPEQPPRQEETP